MPAETANGLPYPLDSDAPDGAAQIKALAEAIDQIPTALIADLAVTEGKLGNASVATAKLIDLAVTTIKLANEAVTEAKLGNLAVATAKLANLAVTAGKLGEESVETSKVKALAITAAKLALDAVETNKIKDEAVTTAKIADKAVTPVKLASMGEVLIVGGEKLNPAPTRAVVVVHNLEEAPVKKMAVGIDGQIATILMWSGNGAFKVTFKASAEEGGFKLASEFAAGAGDTLTVVYDATAKRWIEVSRSNNV